MNITALEKTIRQIMRKRKTPGLSVTVTQDDKVIYSKGFGSRNLKQYLPMNPDTLIGIGSVTKSFTAFAIMQLEEQGKLKIEDSVATHLDVEPFASRPEIKIKHLLSHSSGIPTMDAMGNDFVFPFNDFSHIYPNNTREEFIAHLADADDFIIFQPGERFFYNNDMYVCLAFIIEALSGLAFDVFIQQNILQPLQMERAVLTQQALDNDPDKNVMTGYLFESREGAMHAKATETPIGRYIQAPGGIYTSTNELANYAQCLLNHGAFNGTRLLQADSVETLFGPQMSTPYGRGVDPQYCLGLFKDEKTEQTPYIVIHHGGGMLSSSSHFMMIPELNISVSIAENSATGASRLIADVVVATLLKQEPTEVIEDFKIMNAMKRVLGTYKSPHDMYQFAVSWKNGMLWVDAEIDDGKISFALMAKDIENLEFVRYSLRSDDKNTLKFVLNQGADQVEYVAYDRFLYRKI